MARANAGAHRKRTVKPRGHTLLGRPVAYPQRVDAGVLTAIARDAARAGLDLAPDAPLPFQGEDLWTCHELSWLDAHGVPQRAVAELRVPAGSPALIESKSLKLYLGGYAGERCADTDTVCARIAADLSAAAGATVAVALLPAAQWHMLALAEPPGACIDTAAGTLSHYGPPAPALLRTQDGAAVSETLYSTLFRSNCPVTGQPDWATVVVDYRGPRIDHGALLAYLVSYRTHNAFHEQCVERIWLELVRHCGCMQLTVHARFTRRGGLDINPLRSTLAGRRLPAWRRHPEQ